MNNKELNALLEDPDKRKEVFDFLNKWIKLRSIEQTTLCTHVIRPPLVAAFHRLKTATKLNGNKKGGGAKAQTNTLSFV